MTRGAYNQYRGWKIPKNENPEDQGYLVEYEDGYESWSPKDVFERCYRLVTASEAHMVIWPNRESCDQESHG